MEDFDRHVLNVKDDEAGLLLRKHHDYGPANIARSPGGPIMGLAVRLHDKVARLANLLESGENPNYEALDDTALDIANYGTILSLVLRGQWPGVDEPAAASEADHIEAGIAEAHKVVFGTGLPDPDDATPDPYRWPAHPTMQGRVVVSTAGVHGLVVGFDGTNQSGIVLLRNPMMRRPDGSGWVHSHGLSDGTPYGHWEAVNTTIYNPTWRVGDEVEIAPWSDEDLAGAHGVVTRSHTYEDGSSNVHVRVDDARQNCMFVATELLPIDTPQDEPDVEVDSAAFQVGDHVRVDTHWYRPSEVFAVVDATPDREGELTLADAYGSERWFAPDELTAVERSLDGPYPVRAMWRPATGDPEPVIVTGTHDIHTMNVDFGPHLSDGLVLKSHLTVD